MGDARNAILRDEFPMFLKNFFEQYYSESKNYPQWIIDALRSVSVDLLEGSSSYSVVDEDGVKWDYAK